MKRIIIFLSMALFLSLGINAQTLSTDTFSDANGNMPAVGANFDVPVDVASIGTIFTLTVYLQFDTAVLTYTGYDTANAVANTQVSEYLPGLIKIINGDFPNQSTIADGLLVNLNFDFNGGYTLLRFGTVENPAQGYKSNILTISYVTWEFPEANVTNGAVEGYFDNVITGGDWHTATDWSLGVVPDEHHNVVVAAGSLVTASAVAEAFAVTVKPGAQFTLTSTLDVTNDFTIESDATGDGSFINDGGFLNVGGDITVERYATNGQWHGISSPVIGAKFDVTYFGGNPEVWVKTYDEDSNGYHYLVDTTALMGAMNGYFTWIQTSGSPMTYDFVGSLRTGTVGFANNMVRTNTGHNFVGNPFTSAIDWNASSGWNKQHLYNAIYFYNGSNWASYISGLPTNGGSQYIAVGQGFFVQVESGYTSGTLQMTSDVCVHNTVGFMKDQSEQTIVRLQVEDAGKVDETVIRFAEEATAEFDGNLDAVKLFSFNNEYPQLYSTANDFMSINSVPYGTSSVALDVKGKDGNTLTISATEAEGFEFLNLKDNNTGVTTNLKSEDYTFTYNSNITDRFELFFGFTGIDTPTTADYAKIYAVDNNVKIVLDDGINADITVYNLLGQRVATRSASGNVTTIAVEKSGYYLVKVNDGANVTTKKVFIR
jgi:hypothetical protein